MEDIGITIYSCEQDEAEAFRDLAPRFGVKPRIIGAAVSERNAVSTVCNRCVSVGHKSKVSAAIIEALQCAGVRYISTRSIGYNHIDLAAAAKAGIAVGNVTYSPHGVADYALMLMLMSMRNAKETVRAALSYDFRLSSSRGKELYEMTVGVLGTGRIGEAVIERLRGFGCRVLAYDCCQRIDADYVALDELLQNSDIISLHLPLNAKTHHIIGREQLKIIKRGALLVNTGRGALVDTEALLEALQNGRVGGAALDVLEGEEGLFYFDCSQKAIDNSFLAQLQKLANVIITPHTAYYTERVLRDTVAETIRNCLEFERRTGACLKQGIE